MGKGNNQNRKAIATWATKKKSSKPGLLLYSLPQLQQKAVIG
jgi:hypothetical protein